MSKTSTIITAVIKDMVEHARGDAVLLHLSRKAESDLAEQVRKLQKRIGELEAGALERNAELHAAETRIEELEREATGTVIPGGDELEFTNVTAEDWVTCNNSAAVHFSKLQDDRHVEVKIRIGEEVSRRTMVATDVRDLARMLASCVKVAESPEVEP